MRNLILAITVCLSVSANSAKADNLKLETESKSGDLIIESIRCEGNTETQCEFIKQKIFINAGDILSEEEVSNSKIRLATLPNFKSTDIFLKKGSQRGKVILVVKVAEENPYLSELTVGTNFNGGTVSETLGGRVSHQNLFGKGKILDLEIRALVPVSNENVDSHHFDGQITYTDPHLFNTKKYFYKTGLSYHKVSSKFNDGDSYESKKLLLEFSLGRRIYDFSYISFGLGKYLNSKIEGRYVYNDGTTENYTFYPSDSFGFEYGWDTEDDSYFPTKGSRFATSLFYSNSKGQEGLNLQVGLGGRRTWSTTGGTIWTLKIGGNPQTALRNYYEDGMGYSLSYARPINASKFESINKGRWYIEPGFNGVGYSSSQGTIYQAGAKAGVRLDTKALGIVDLYAFGRSEWSNR
ncbi:MAG: BamA/TamA family outer membrane protein [Bdellovibrionaceae bacterium]|jgi:outer membrane protein assembly factor BamA|nr:BamA/TamA family outer membrane protein [Pseudobdellovibrionaceae bacterium]